MKALQNAEVYIQVKNNGSVNLLAMNDHGSGAVGDGSAEQCSPHPSSEFYDVVGIWLDMYIYLLTERNVYHGLCRIRVE